LIPPEEGYISLIKQAGEEIGDDRFALNAIFLTTSMIFGERTDRQFKRVESLDLIREFSWIFQPEQVLAKPYAQDAVREFFRPGGYNNRSVKEWHHNCQVLDEQYGGDIRRFFWEKQNDAVRIVDSLVVYPRKRNKEGFRRFGPKLARLFVQWVNQYNLYSLMNVDQIGVPVDFQVARILTQTGGLRLVNPGTVHDVNEKILTPLLAEMCLENGWDPRKVSESLYLLGNQGCNQGQHKICPVRNSCTMLISRKPYDKDGLIDPTSSVDWRNG